MIAGCPKCGARYRIEREKLTAGGVRLRCAKCDSVFRVRAPEPERAAQDRTQLLLDPPPRAAAEPAPPNVRPSATQAVAARLAPPPASVPPGPAASGDLVLIAIPEADIAKSLVDALNARGVRTLVAHDGVEAVLELQRQLPKAAVVAAHLPKMFGFQICELVKRNESLRGTWIILAGAIHNQERYRRPASDTYGADAYLELPDLPDGVLPLLRQGGVRLEDAAPAPQARPARPSVTSSAAPQQVAAPASAAPAALPSAALAPRAPQPAPAPVRPRAGDGLDDQRAKAERLARIIVSDIVLYNEQKFAAAIRKGNVVEALDGDLAEGRHLFQERIDARVRSERDYLAEELLRVAKSRGAK
jgi:predicted Zn finger-like uncharacterized protein